MSAVNKTFNQYAEMLSPAFYENCPKAVLAAIAVSALTCGGDWIEEAELRVAKEWEALYVSGIVPQRPNSVARAALANIGASQ